jgi:hypothetical protein
LSVIRYKQNPKGNDAEQQNHRHGPFFSIEVSMIGGYLVRVTVTREGEPPARVLYVVAEADEDAAIAIVRRRARAIATATVESLGPVTKAEVKRRGVKAGDAALVL